MHLVILNLFQDLHVMFFVTVETMPEIYFAYNAVALTFLSLGASGINSYTSLGLI